MPLFSWGRQQEEFGFNKPELEGYYILDPEGVRISEVIRLGPYFDLKRAEEVKAQTVARYEIHKLLVRKVDNALKMEADLQDALARYGGKR